MDQVDQVALWNELRENNQEHHEIDIQALL